MEKSLGFMMDRFETQIGENKIEAKLLNCIFIKRSTFIEILNESFRIFMVKTTTIYYNI